MVAAKTTDDLILDVIAAAQLQSDGAGTITDGRVSNDDVLTWASKLLSTSIASMLLACSQERWVWQDSDQTIVSGTAKYRIPSRALASGVASLVILDGSSNEFHPPQISAADRYRYASSRVGPWRSPFAMTWEGDHIVLLPTPAESGFSLRVRFPRQPPRLVAVSACAVVASTTSTVITTTATVPTAWTASETLDLNEGTPHGDALGLDLAGTSISGTSITIAAGVPSELAAGDYVSLAGHGCTLPVPEVVYHLLVDLVIVEVLRRIGSDPADLQEARDAAAASMVHVRDILEPRDRGASPKPIRRNSPLRAGRLPYGWGW